MISVDPSEALELATAAASNNKPLEAAQLYADLLARTSADSGDKTIQAARLTALRERGRLFTLLGEPRAALAAYERYYVEAGNSRHAVDALVAIGNQCTYMNLTDRAIEAHRDALRLAEGLNYTAGRAKALGGMGLVYNFLDRFEEALKHLQESLTLFKQLGDKVEQARCWNRIGVAHVHMGELDKAITAFENSFTLADNSEDSVPIALETAIISLNNLGECYQNLFDMEQALIHHRQGQEMAVKTELPYLEADLSRNLGVEFCYLGQVEEGIECLYRSLQLSVDTNQPDIEVQSLYSLALSEYQRGNLSKSRESAQHLRDVADESGNRGSLAEALHVLGLCQKQAGDVEGAQGLWQQALFLAHETGRRMLLWRLHAALAEVAPNQELSSVHDRIAGEIIEQIARPIEDAVLREKFLSAAPVRDVLERLTPGNWGSVTRHSGP